MLNAHQTKEFLDGLRAGRPPVYAHIPYVSFEWKVADWGEVIAGTERPEEEVTLPAPYAVVGEPEHPSLPVRAVPGVALVPRRCVRRFHDVQLVGWRSLITPSGFFSSAKPWRYEQRDQVVQSIHEGYAFDGKVLYRATSSRNTDLAIGGKGLFLSYLEPGNHGSFIFRAMPKLLFALQLGLQFDYVVAPDRFLGIRYVLDMTGHEETPIYTCKEVLGSTLADVLVIDDFDAEGTFTSETLVSLRNLVDRIRQLRNSQNLPEKIYVSRRLNTNYRPAYRPLLNEESIEHNLRSRGYSVVAPESLGFLSQVLLFASAKSIVGPSGSGMLNASFAEPETQVVDLESFHNTVTQHARIYGSTGKRYAFAFGKFAENSGELISRAWTIDPALVDSAIDRLT